MAPTDGRDETFAVVEERGVRYLQAMPGRRVMASPADARSIVEGCFSMGVSAVVLRPEHLSSRFFDLSSGEAGEILQKLRTYGLRLAVVCEPGTARMSSHFPELLAEECTRNDFGVFESKDAAVTWLNAGSHP